MNVYQIECEWDIGLEGIVFLSEKVALDTAKKYLLDHKIYDDFEYLRQDGYVVLRKLRVID